MFNQQKQDEYVDQYKLLHSKPRVGPEGAPVIYGAGVRSTKRAKFLQEMITKYQVESLLDYGCGKGLAWTRDRLQDQLNIKVYLYDPAVDRFSKRPKGPRDMTWCADVMEHIPEENVQWVLEDIYKLSRKCVYFSIAMDLADAILPNGENAHCTVKPKEWWQEKIDQANTNKIFTHVDFLQKIDKKTRGRFTKETLELNQ